MVTLSNVIAVMAAVLLLACEQAPTMAPATIETPAKRLTCTGSLWDRSGVYRDGALHGAIVADKLHLAGRANPVSCDRQAALAVADGAGAAFDTARPTYGTLTVWYLNRAPLVYVTRTSGSTTCLVAPASRDPSACLAELRSLDDGFDVSDLPTDVPDTLSSAPPPASTPAPSPAGYHTPSNPPTIDSCSDHLVTMSPMYVGTRGGETVVHAELTTAMAQKIKERIVRSIDSLSDWDMGMVISEATVRAAGGRIRDPVGHASYWFYEHDIHWWPESIGAHYGGGGAAHRVEMTFVNNPSGDSLTLSEFLARKLLLEPSDLIEGPSDRGLNSADHGWRRNNVTLTWQQQGLRGRRYLNAIRAYTDPFHREVTVTVRGDLEFMRQAALKFDPSLDGSYDRNTRPWNGFYLRVRYLLPKRRPSNPGPAYHPSCR